MDNNQQSSDYLSPENQPIQPVAPAPENYQSATPPKKPKLPESVRITLLIFTGGSALVLGLLPRISTKSSIPPFWLLLLIGLIMIAFTALLFRVLSSLNLGFGKTALVMAFGYNSVIAVIKFVLSPRSLYLANQKTTFSTGALAGPNSSLFYVITAGMILLLYVGVFWFIYKHFRKRIERTFGIEREHKKSFSAKDIGWFFLGLVIMSIFSFGLVLYVPLMLIGYVGFYLNYAFVTEGIPIFIALVLAILMAYYGFKNVEQQVRVTGNMTLLASFLWLGVSLIIIYHILWIIFMITLVHIWPFNTYTPK